MKKRSRFGRRRTWSRTKPLGAFTGRGARKRKTFSFERLEERLAFSVEPLQMQTVSLSSSTPEGAAAILARELQWAVMQTPNAANTVQPLYGLMQIPTDPLFPDPDNPDQQGQWHLWNIGQPVGNPDLQDLFGVPGEDINVVPVWQGTGLQQPYTGAGVLVAVIDSGVQLFHPDLTANIHPTLRFNATTGTNNASPNLGDPEAYHGTAVAGIIGAVENNGIGGVGVAPGVILVPIRRDFFSTSEEELAFQWVMQNDIDITNNSYGPIHEANRNSFPLTPEEQEILRNSVIFGRDGLGIIHVFSSGNDGGPFFSPGFGVIGNQDSTSYNAFANSRFVITVTGVDHDGQYINEDGTFTSYPTTGPNVLVAAPTGSNGAITVAEDDGYGSGIWTTDLVGNFGFNQAPFPGGFDPDQDPWPDPDYTSRFNGTSASAPMVTGVIALMLEANPDLTYRDVQNILVRSARQNAQFETPSSGSLQGERPTWQTNQLGPFRDPDIWIPNNNQSPSQSIFNPLADPNNEGTFLVDFFAPEDSFDGGRQIGGHYEPQPALFTNGAGYTVSQGHGVYSEQVGYGHGVVDAELAVWMAERWHSLGQNVDRLTEKTYTTSVVSFGSTHLNLPAAEKMSDDNGAMLVPGAMGGLGGFIGYWNEYFADDDPLDPLDGPFSQDDPPVNTRGFSYLDFAVPPAEGIAVEWVEVKLDISGPVEDLDFLRIMLTSPEGTQSEFNHFWADPGISTPLSFQPISTPGESGDFIWLFDPAGTIDTDPDGGGTFNWTFSTNRNWGETTNTSVIIDPVTGEPLVAETFGGTPFAPIFRDWELHIENWSNSDFGLAGMEVVWHGRPIGGGQMDPNWNIAAAQRVQGFVGLDSNNDEQFNFRRSVQSVDDSDGDPDTVRLLDVTRQLDYDDNNFNGIFDTGDVVNQEPFADQILVKARRVVNPGTQNEFVEANGFDFLTGADGNYYFDLDPTQTWEISIEDLTGLPRTALDDVTTPGTAPSGLEYAPHFLASWRITPDWFYAPDRDNPIVPGNEPAEIFWGQMDANGDGTLSEGPLPFLDVGAPVPMAVKNVNFLLKQDALPDQIEITGTVYLDVNVNGEFDPSTDAPLSGVRMYVDEDRNEQFDQGEESVETAADGTYSFTIAAASAATIAIGVDPASSPTSPWEPTEPGGLVKSVFAEPGDPPSIIDFFLAIPDDDTPGIQVGNIMGFVFNDLDEDGVRDVAELGVEGILVFDDVDQDGAWDNDGDTLLEPGEEAGVITNAFGSYVLSNLPGGVHFVTIVTTGTTYVPTDPASGVRQVSLNNGQTRTGILFGVDNLADRDFGDLPASYSTLEANNGPSHGLQNFFRLGPNISGELDGQPSAGANVDTADDGVVVVGGNLVPGVNTLRVTTFGVGGALTGWIDWNQNGTFQANERLIWSDANGNLLGGEADLSPGTFNLRITAPAVTGPVAARFRWGEPGLDFFGPARIGEVEDYILTAGSVAIFAGDYNGDNQVDTADYVVWRRYMGTNTVLPGDTTPGSVGQDDFLVWKQNYGNVIPGAGSGGGGGTSAPLMGAGPSSPATTGTSGGSGSSALASANPGSRSITAPGNAVSIPSRSFSEWVAFLSASSSAQSSLAAAPVVEVVPQATPVSSGVNSSPGVSIAPAVTVSPLLEAFSFDSSASVSTAPSASFAQADESSSGSGQSYADLLLLDEALAEFDDDASDEDAPLCDRQSSEDESADDLALAAVFDDDSDWWSL